MPFKKKRKRAVGKRSPGKSRTRVVVVGKRKTRRHHVSGIGSTHHHAPKKRRKSRSIMGFSSGGKIMQVVEMAAGVGIGAAGTHMLLRPMEHKLVEHMPMAAKFMGGAEIILGGFIALKSKNNFIKSIGIGVLAGGVHTVMHQIPQLGMHSPAEGAHMGDMSVIRVPMNGDLRGEINGLIENNGNRFVRTSVVSGSDGIGVLNNNNGGAVYTNVVGDANESELSEDDRNWLYKPRGI